LIYADNKFVAVGNGGYNPQIIKYSYDGKTWITSLENNSGNALKGIAYGNGKFVAATFQVYSNLITDNNVYVSTDGINWNGYTQSFSNGYINNISYGGGKFFCVQVPTASYSIGTGSLFTSLDGENWSENFVIISGSNPEHTDYINNKFYAYQSYVSREVTYNFSKVYGIDVADDIDTNTFNSGILKNGKLYFCGGDWNGQFGFVSVAATTIFVESSITNVRNFSLGNGATYYVTDDNNLWGLGGNFGRFGKSSGNEPWPILIDTDVSQSFSNVVNLYIKNDESLIGMGYNAYGKISPTNINLFVTKSIIDNDVINCSEGQYHIAYVKSDGTLWTRGGNDSGQLGDGTNTDSTSSIQIDTNVEMVSCGYAHTIYLKNDGTLWGMGRNTSGQLGLGDNSDRNVPTQITSSVLHVSCREHSTMFVTTDGKVYGMGVNGDSARLGIGTNVALVNVPTLTNITSDAKKVSCGIDVSLVVKNDGSVYAAGNGLSQGADASGILKNNTKSITFSEDGNTFQTASVFSGVNVADIEYGNGRYVTIGRWNDLQYSTDSYNWTGSLMGYKSGSGLMDFNSVVFDGTKFLTATIYSEGPVKNDVFTSTDGINWTESSTGYVGNPWGYASYGNGTHVLLRQYIEDYIHIPTELNVF